MGQGGIGCLSGLSEQEAKKLIAEYLVESDGKMVHAAHHIGYSRPHVYRLVHRFRLWPLVNRLRLDRIQRERLEKKHGLPSKRHLEHED